MIKKHHVPLFVTLTYHKQYSQDFKDYKTDLHNFFKRLARRFPGHGAIWKMEFQKRGAVHFHLLLWGVPADQAREFIPSAWHDIAGYGSEKHLQWHKGELKRGNRHCVQEIKSWNGVMSYAGKYFAKLDGNTRGGRVWGVRGEVPYSKLIDFVIDFDQALEFRYWFAVTHGYQFKRLGFWTNDYASTWLSFLMEVLYPPGVPWTHDIVDFDLDEEPGEEILEIDLS